MNDAREYLSADAGPDGANRLQIKAGGDGDWYVSILRPGERIGVSVRVTTSKAQRGQEHVAPAVAALHRVMSAADPEPITCTGIAASWCPVHGNCTCPWNEDYGRSDEPDPECPLHGDLSGHASEAGQ